MVLRSDVEDGLDLLFESLYLQPTIVAGEKEHERQPSKKP